MNGASRPVEVFSRTIEGEESLDLAVTLGRMTLYSAVPMDREGILLDITVSTRPCTGPEVGDEMLHELTTQWLTIERRVLGRRDAAALDGLAIDWVSTGDWREQAPAAVYDGSYGMVSRLAMTLTHLDGIRYRLRATGRSEFDQGFAIDCSVRLEWVMLRPNEGVSETDAEAMLADLFDIEGTWRTHGGREHRWRDLVGRFGD